MNLLIILHHAQSNYNLSSATSVTLFDTVVKEEPPNEKTWLLTANNKSVDQLRF